MMLSTLPLTITVQGPVLTRATAIGGFGVDAPAARLDDGTPYLAGSHILGKVRHVLLSLLEAQGAAKAAGPVPSDFLEKWFGGTGDEAEGYTKRRRLFISDLKAAAGGNADGTRTRIAIDNDRDAAEEGALQTLEMPYRSGEPIAFTGEVHLLGPASDRAAMAAALRAGLNWISQVGGLRTIGFGRVLNADLGATSARVAKVLPPPATGTKLLRLALRFHDPVCIAETRNSGNTFTTSDAVPGGVIKGAIANLIAAAEGNQPGTAVTSGLAFPKLSQHFSKLRFSHLFPAPMEHPVRPSRWSRSLVVDTDGNFHDAALWEKPKLLNGHAPTFCHDWKGKHYATANGLVGWPHVKRTLRVRTAINFDELRAEEEALFAYEMLAVSDHVWLGEIGLEDVPDADHNALISELSAILARGLPGIGRSQSFATLAQDSWASAARSVPLAPNADLFTIILQTPALLRAPGIHEPALHDPAEGYQRSIHDLSGGTLKYVRHFATERLSGASFMANRYWKNREYKPWLLTEPGTVFVVEAIGNASDKLTEFATKGLGLPQNVRAFYGLTGADEAGLWNQCPFISQNGFGEVAIAGFVRAKA